MADHRDHRQPPDAPGPAGVADPSLVPIGRDDLGLNATRFARRTVHNGAATVASNVWAMVVGAATLPVVLRGLGTDQFGQWVLIASFSAVNGWLALADLGVRTAAVRAIAGPLAVGDRMRADQAFGAVVRTLAVLAVFAGVVVVALGRAFLPALFHTPEAMLPVVRTAWTWFALQVVAELAFVPAHAALEGAQRVDISRFVHSLRQTAVAVAVAVVATASGSLDEVVRAAALTTMVACLAGSAITIRFAPLCPRRPTPGMATSLLRYGVSIGAINFTGVLHRTMDRAVVGIMYGPRQVVLVEIATQIANGAQTLLGAAHALTAAAPWLHARGDGERLAALLIRGTRLSTIVAIPGIALAAVLATPIITVWVGAAHREAAGLTVLAVLGVAAAVPAQAASLLLQATGRARSVLRPALFAVAANLVLSVALSRIYGTVGVFVATLITALGLLVPLIRPALAATDVPASRFLRAAIAPTIPVAASSVAGAALGLLVAPPLNALVVGALGGGVAWSIATWQWGLTASDRIVLRDALRRTPTSPGA